MPSISNEMACSNVPQRIVYDFGVLAPLLRHRLERAELRAEHRVHGDPLTKVKPWNALFATNDFVRRE